MANYLVLLYESPTSVTDVSPEEIQRIIEKYRAWSERLAEKGHLKEGHKLKDREGRVLRAAEGKVRVMDGPFSETKEVVGGFFAIQASSYDEATALLKDCPHLDYGGAVEIRQIDDV